MRRFSEWLTEHAEHPEWPPGGPCGTRSPQTIFIDEPGIWLSAQHPFLAGSPDGIVYECLEAHPISSDGGTYYRCRRSLLEIKTADVCGARPRPTDALEASASFCRR